MVKHTFTVSKAPIKANKEESLHYNAGDSVFGVAHPSMQGDKAVFMVVLWLEQ